MSRHPGSILSFVPAVGLFTLLGCATPAAPPGRLAVEIDSACGGPAWRHRRALAADVMIRRDGHADLRGSLLYDTRRDQLVIEFLSPHGGLTSVGSDGSTLWADGTDASAFYEWVKIMQWARWVAVPYRLTDSAYRVREVRPLSLERRSYRIAEVESPPDGRALCALFIDPTTLRPRGAVPVLPANVPTDGVVPAYGLAYEQFSVCKDVSVPTRWSIWDWNAHTGIVAHGPVASVTLDHLRFVQPDPARFTQPRPESTVTLPSAPADPRRTRVEEDAHGNG